MRKITYDNKLNIYYKSKITHSVYIIRSMKINVKDLVTISLKIYYNII